MKRILILAIALTSIATATEATADILFESGTLGPTGVTWMDLESQSVPGTNISRFAYNGVRFELNKPVLTTAIGGHFVAATEGTFFGAVVKLNDANDFPNSGDLATPDVLGHALLEFPTLSAEVSAELELSLNPGWYALVFGSGLFGAATDGGDVRNGMDLNAPAYIAFQPGSGWVNVISSFFDNHRFVVVGTVVPEPPTVALAGLAFVFVLGRGNRYKL